MFKHYLCEIKIKVERNSLLNILETYKQNGIKASPKFLTKIIYDLVAGLFFLKQKEITDVHVSLSTVQMSYDKKGFPVFKITPSLRSEKTRQENQYYFLYKQPFLMKLDVNIYELDSQLFSIGIIILQLATQRDLSSLYELTLRKFNHDLLAIIL